MRSWRLLFFLFLFVQTVQAQSAVDSLIVTSVDTYPQFRSGAGSWNKFVQANLDVRKLVNSIDSTSYVDYGLRQTAVLEFTVCEDGEVCDVAIINKNKISPEFAEEALRVMRKSPKWIPAKKEGKGVRTRIKQSITALLDR
ncbi:energy transducer TonB [Sphingobacterium paludis]|uniref:TonB-like protein n=1 Tax=Sphingobacterium paludis TaxID=1476465 RepID=A0A4R7CZQ9_9SPHI|nr:energy transducer TonB [Sphingobacterium paludis]TDS14099.1 TonB-like protein [Sphingobacterium paludis]